MQRIPEDRWMRLERYARFRSSRMKLMCLPDDVLETISSLLDGPDLRRLVEAVTGVGSVAGMEHVSKPLWLEMPGWTRNRWLFNESISSFEAMCYNVAEKALFHCHDCGSAVMYVNWSQFKSITPPRPVATYDWDVEQGAVKANVKVDKSYLLRVLHDCVRKRSPSVRVTMHLNFVWPLQTRPLVHPVPFFSSSHCMLPWISLM